MGGDLVVKISKNIENLLLKESKEVGHISGHTITSSVGEIYNQMADGASLVLKGPKESGVEGGVKVDLLDRKTSVRKTYMAKVMFGKNDISKSGKYRKQNAKNKVTYFATGRTKNKVNNDVLKEYISLKIANIVYPGIAPETKLGEISDDKRLFLMTEMQGQGEDENFKTIGEVKKINTSDDLGIKKEQWKAAYAITVGLLNDSDANKSGNMGVVSKSNNNRLSLFDLGHANPNKFALDSDLLPRARTKFGEFLTKIARWLHIDRKLPQVFTMESFIQDKLTIEDRKESLKNLCDKKKEIIKCLEDAIINLKDMEYNTDVLKKLRKEIEERLEYLEEIMKQKNDKEQISITNPNKYA